MMGRKEQARSLFGALHEVWGELEYDYEELIDAGEHVVAVVTRPAQKRPVRAASGA